MARAASGISGSCSQRSVFSPWYLRTLNDHDNEDIYADDKNKLLPSDVLGAEGLL